MSNQSSIKKIVTLGPASNTAECLARMKDRGVDFVRVNMSHSTLEDLRYFISLAKQAGIPFMLDTEGSQVRTGDLKEASLYIDENDEIKIYSEPILGDEDNICLRPGNIIRELEPGDILRPDFNTLALRIADISSVSQGYITARAVSGGLLGRNKGVVIDSASGRQFALPVLSPKDYQAIDIGLKEGVDHIAASFMRSGDFVDAVRDATKGTMRVVSKIECIDGLRHLDDIIQKSDYILVDRGDLSKEIPLERIPLTQKLIIYRAKKYGKETIIATNLLETMVREPKPTRAEIHDIVNSIIDGAAGLTLAAETAIGKYPVEAVNMLDAVIRHVQQNIDVEAFAHKESELVRTLEEQNYLLGFRHSSLVPPHGGKLINRVLLNIPDANHLESLPRINLTENQFMDAEQIATGAFSPLEGFMCKRDVEAVLETMRLTNGVIWPIPIVLDISHDTADAVGQLKNAALYYEDTAVGLLSVEEKFSFDKNLFEEKLYGTTSKDHPGVRMVEAMQPMLLGGRISMFNRRSSPTKQYELAPAQTRSLFEDRGWSKVVGFHTRNVIHRSHEFIQLKALEEETCDGLFVHPVVGKKKPGDFHAKYIVQSYEAMLDKFYPKNKVVFATLATFSRYAGPREALFTAICRKNFGCSHFIVGRDHTGVGGFYSPEASHEIFDRFPDLGIKPVKFREVFYSPKANDHIHASGGQEILPDDRLHISGTEARNMFKMGQSPPEWFMRPEIAEIILDALRRGEEVFVK